MPCWYGNSTVLRCSYQRCGGSGAGVTLPWVKRRAASLRCKSFHAGIDLSHGGPGWYWVLVCSWWWFDWSKMQMICTHFMVPVVIYHSIIFCCSKFQNGLTFRSHYPICPGILAIKQYSIYCFIITLLIFIFLLILLFYFISSMCNIVMALNGLFVLKCH